MNLKWFCDIDLSYGAIIVDHMDVTKEAKKLLNSIEIQ